jgi:hypothetical protein
MPWDRGRALKTPMGNLKSLLAPAPRAGKRAHEADGRVVRWETERVSLKIPATRSSRGHTRLPGRFYAGCMP